ncbi:MAG: hypothetical protein K2Y05_07745, partial [Hyphomicrobiaceae bacterium]|nr:hypothetical protein [Burkholderiaceae bacterium]MBX9926235.1 hypothetical protein [Hyphomicrobiaceae bacterium]
LDGMATPARSVCRLEQQVFIPIDRRLCDGRRVRSAAVAAKGSTDHPKAADRWHGSAPPRRYDPWWRGLSDAMRAKGKPASVIVGAVANRWVRRLYHQMKEDVPAAA